VDVAVRIGALSDSSLRSLTVGRVRRVLVASPDYLARAGNPQSVAELANHEIVAFSGISPGDEWHFGGVERVSVRVKPRLIVNTADAAIAAVEADLGITRVLSYQVIRQLSDGRLALVLDRHAPPEVPVSLVYPGDRAASRARRVFLDEAATYFRSVSFGFAPS
jgi:DNA-binding transcriptional LysR family regulator